ncbi:MAG: putative rane protein, partial [Mycobacterium sp.]|nr:putative rane protein [Mycobacterium sp.]
MTNFESKLTAVTPAAVSVFRIVLGLLFTIRGTQKLFDWPIAAPVDIAFGSFPLWWAGVIELLAGVLILIGFVTRFA